MAVDFVVEQEPLEQVKQLVLKANFEETKAALAEMVSPYQGMIVSPDAISNAKTDRAKIRKVSANIDSYRKSVKSIYEKPLKEFEAKCKELTGICDSAAGNLDAQIKRFEEEIKQAKLSEIQTYFSNIPKKHPEYADFNRIFDQRWLNSTFRIENAQELMTNFCKAVDSDVDAIKSLDSSAESFLLSEYMNGKTVSQIIAIDRQMKGAAEQKRRAEEERRIREEERKRMEAEIAAQSAQNHAETLPEQEGFNPTDVVPELRQTVVPKEEVPEETEGLHTVNLWVRGTREQLALLSRLFHEAGVEYGAL